VLLRSYVDYAPRTGGLLNANDIAFGNYLGRIELAGGAPSLTHFMQNVFATPHIGELKALYDRVGSGGSVALGAAALQNTLAFSNDMLQCRNQIGETQNGNCSWGSLGTGESAQTASFEGGAYQQHVTGFSSGYQRAIGTTANTSIGAALHYDSGALVDTTNAQSFSGSSLSGGVSAKRYLPDGTALSANLSAGIGNFASTRNLSYPALLTSASGTQAMSYLSAHLRAEHSSATPDSSVTPFVDFGATRINAGALQESGAGALDEHVGAHSQTFPTIALGASFDTTRNLGTSKLRGGIDLAVTQILGAAYTSAPVTLAGAPASVAPFTITNAVGRTHFDVAPSLELSRANRLDVKVSGVYDFSSTTHGFGAGVQIGTRL